jgi:hypothetical protein
MCSNRRIVGDKIGKVVPVLNFYSAVVTARTISFKRSIIRNLTDTVCLCVPFGSPKKQELLPQILTDWSLYW